MLALTSKQKAFCRQLASGVSQAEAYRRSYNAENMKPETIYREAHELMKNPKVAAMVERLSSDADSQIVSERIASKTEILETLTRLMRGEESADSNRVRATQLLAQAQGLLKDQTELLVKERTSDEIREELFKKLHVLNPSN